MKSRLQIPLAAGAYALSLVALCADPAPATGAAPAAPPATSSNSSPGTDLNSLQSTLAPKIDASSLIKSDAVAAPTADPSPEYEVTQQLNQPKIQAPTAADIQSYLERKDRETNWLVYGYADQQRASGMANGNTVTTDDLQSSRDAALAKLAGISFYHPQSSNPTKQDPGQFNPSSATNGADNKNNATTNPDRSSLSKTDDKNGKDKSQIDPFKPLIVPMLTPAAAGLQNIHVDSSLTKIKVPSDSDLDSQFSKLKGTDDYSLLDTPGLTAAKSDLLSDPSLMPDQLPGQSTDTDMKLHSDTYSPAALPVADGMLQLQNQQDAALNAPVAPQALSITSSTSSSSNDASALALPATPPPPISYGATEPAPVRPRIAKPSDFLDR